MPEVEKQTSSVQEVESLEKPGGLAFQVLLEDAKSKDAPKMESPPTPTPSVEDIQKRLKNAECRRKSMKPLLWRNLLWRRRRERRCEQRRRASVTPPRKRRRLQELRSRPLNKLLRLFHNVVMLRKLA